MEGGLFNDRRDGLWLNVRGYEWNNYLVRLRIGDTVIDEEIVDWRESRFVI